MPGDRTCWVGMHGGLVDCGRWIADVFEMLCCIHVRCEHVSVSTQIPSLCDTSSTELSSAPEAAPLASGLLSSFLARNGGLKAAGSPACPWSLRAPDYQRISLSVIEFPDATVGSDVITPTFPACIVVVDRTATGNRSTESMFCAGGGRRRDSLVYTSTSSTVDVYVANMTSSREFLIKYEGACMILRSENNIKN